MNELISVIVPIYGVEKYLNRCVESIVEQTYTNLEIILVDDGSRDTCPQICDEWAKRDRRIRVLHKANGGLSDARNAGLKISTGDLVAFVDSDDFINRRMYEVLLSILNKTDADIAECNYMRFETVESLKETKKSKIDYTYLNSNAAISELIADGELKQTVWNKLYRRKVIGDVLFPVGKINEDEFWTYRIFDRSNGVTKVDAILYYYFQREGSIICQNYSLNRLDAIEAKEERNDYLKHRYDSNVCYMASVDLMNTYFYHFQQLCAFNELDKNKMIRKKLFNKYKGLSLYLKKDGYVLSNTFWQKAFKKAPFLTCQVRNLLGIGK